MSYGRILAFPLLVPLLACPSGRPSGDDDDAPPVFPEIQRFEAERRVVLTGESTTLSYAVSNASSVAIEPGLLASTAEMSGMVSTGPLLATTTFTLRAKSAAGETERRLVITVQSEPDVRIVELVASPSIVEPGGSAELRWSTEGATRVVLSVLGGSVLLADADLSGSFTVTPNGSTTYLLSAQRGDEKPVTAEVTVLVGTVPVIDAFSASPAQITTDPSTLSWSVRNADSVSLRATDGTLAVDDLPLSGTHVVGPAETTEYRLLASNEVSSAVANVTVQVLPPGSARILTFTITPTSLASPGQVTVDWETADAEVVDLTANGTSVQTFPRTPSGTTMIAVGQTTRFELRAENGQGSTSAGVTVNVGNPDGMAPVIQHVRVIDGQREGTAVDVAATIIDAGSGVAGATLFYRRQGDATFSSVVMTDEGNDRFRGTIPAAGVRPPAVEYYILASDAAPVPNAGTDPQGAPANLHRFSVAPDDQLGPTIVHAPITSEQLEGQPLVITAEITDASGVAGATLYHRVQGAAMFTGAGMQNSGGSTYQVTITAAPPAIEYYVEARDTIQPANLGRHPQNAPATIHLVPVEALDVTPPAMTHTPIANGQQAGNPVTVTVDVSDATGVGTVTLFYKRSSAAAYTSLVMTGAGATKVAQIPAGTVMEPRVDYYIEALDTAVPAANLARVPAGAPTTPYSFTVTPVDAAPPTISHTPISDGRPAAQAVTVSADIVDASGVALVNLHYRRRGMGAYQSVAMSGGPTYAGSIPGAAVQDPGVEYYIQAVDAAPQANGAFLPANAPTTVFTFDTGAGEVEPNDTSAQATPLLSGTRLTNIGLGALAPTTDRDYWIIDIPAGANRYNVSLDVTIGGAGVCSTADTRLRLYGSNGTTVLVEDDDDGPAACSRINPATDSGARALAPGRYYAQIEEDGRNATVPGYELRGALAVSVCGNNILETAIGEQCDDGATANGDGCSSTCRIEPEATFNAPGGTHAGAISPAGDTDTFAVVVAQGQFLSAETSNGAGGCPGDTVLELYGPDGNTLIGSDDDDGNGNCSSIDPRLDSFAANMAAGTYFLRVRAYGAADVIASYTLTIGITNNICGNRQIETGEQCDDGNTSSNDGCSASCQWETRGTAMGTGASFTDSISPIGNVDWFAVVVPAGNSIRAETFSPADGMCGGSADTVIRLWQSNRTTQITSDDDGGVGSCSLLDPATTAAVRGLAAGTYYLSVEDYQNNATIGTYVLNVSIQPPVCGDGFLGGAETCDDGNTMPNDGCSATCQFEGTGELEPNNTTAAATSFIAAGGSSGTIFGAIQSTGDVDLYRVVVQSPAHLLAEVRGPDGGCPVNTTLRLLSSTGAQLATDTSDGPGDCGRLSPGADSAARSLAAGTYYLEVTASEGTSRNAYLLDARLLTPGCGDLYRSGAEQCDDGNTSGGDGCSATCQFELLEMEPNNTSSAAQSLGNVRMVSGSISPAGDSDWYSVVLPQGGSLSVATHQGAPDQCPSPIDTVVTLYGPTGTQIAEDDLDGPALCSNIYRNEARNLPAGTYRIRVRGFSASATMSYALSVTVD